MTDHEQARLIYFIILLIFVMCSFGFYYRKNLERITRHFLSWALIFIGLVTAYGFKDVYPPGFSLKSVIKVGRLLFIQKRGTDIFIFS